MVTSISGLLCCLKLKKFISIKNFNIGVEKDIDAVKIISFLTFDGHLMKDLSGFYFCSKQRETLKTFENLLYTKFKLRGYLEKGTGHGESYKLRFYNAILSKALYSLGAPKGNKVLTNFSIPAWIKNNNLFCKEYLTVAFDCEGSIWKESNRFCIRFGIFKNEKLISSTISFIADLKDMLNRLGVQTTKPWLMNGSFRKDGIATKGVYFKIKQNSLPAFAKNIGFSDTFKNTRLISWSGHKKLSSTGS